MGLTDASRRPKPPTGRTGVTQTHQMESFPAPVSGLNLSPSPAAAGPTDAFQLINLIPRTYGPEIRKGWREWRINLPEFPVRTIIPHMPASPLQAKLFAALNGDVYEVTSMQTDPLEAEAVPVIDGDYGANGLGSDWSFVQFQTGAVWYTCMVNGDNGYWTYDTVGGWVQHVAGVGAGEIDGTDPATWDFVTTWKNRLWFVPRDSGTAYYLPVSVIAGAAAPFEFAQMFKNGGTIAAMFNWTFDGGEDIDDYLVVVGTEGDVLVYRGTNPASATTFQLQGQWYIGRVPMGRRWFYRYGGDVLMLSVQGLRYMSDVFKSAEVDFSSSPLGRINTRLSVQVAANINEPFWEIKVFPNEQIGIVNMPTDVLGYDQQYVVNVVNKSWCNTQGFGMLTCERLGDELYFGTDDGRVCQAFIGDRDEVEIGGDGGTDIEGAVLTAFQKFSNPNNKKQFLQVKTTFLARIAPAIKAVMNAQYSLSFPGGSPAFDVDVQSLWDVSLWNEAFWAGSDNTYEAWVGVTGEGYLGALAMRVRGLPGTIFISWGLLYNQGGLMA